MVGAAFSPAYHAARRRGPADPERYCAINVSLRGSTSAWVMTERRSCTRAAGALGVSGSTMRRAGDSLVVHVDERQAPFGGRVRGTVHVTGLVDPGEPALLDAAGRHRWWPVGPRARVQVELEEPALSFEGEGYADCNEGDVPLERDLRSWCWSRTPGRVFFDVVPREGTPRVLDLPFGDGGPTPPAFALPRTSWGLARTIRSSTPPRLVREVETGPFYARAVVEVGGGLAMHEVLSLDRLRSPVVRFMLPFRMRQAWR